MTLSFLDSDEPGLGPLGPVRLAFLVRQALGEVSAPATAEAEVQYEVWARRLEIADRTTGMLEEYAEIQDVCLRRWQTAAFIRAPGEALWLFGWLGLIVTVGGMVLNGEYSIKALWWVAMALCIVAGGALRRGAGARRRAASNGLAEAHERLISSTVLDEIVAIINEIVYRDDERAKGALFYPMSAPTLVEFENAAVIDSASFEEVQALVEQHVTSAIGVAGPRGVGKSTLLRLLCETPNHVGIYLPAPSSAADQQFVKVIHSTTANKVIAIRGGELTRPWWTPVRRRLKNDVALAQEAVDRIERSTTRQRAGKMGTSRYGLTAERSGQTTWTERERTRGDWVADFRQWADLHRLRSGPPIIIAIDELDKIADPAQAIEVINALKELFHVQGVHFVVSVSNDALTSFASRGVPVRDAFDTAFDSVIEVGRLTADKSYELLRQRQRRFPYPAALFCHAWSGGLPRDLVRAARSCVTLTNRSADPVPLAALVHRTMRRDVAEILDATIRGDQEQLSADALESLLALRRALQDSSTPPHDVLRSRTSLDDASASLAAYLDIAAAISAYYSISRNSEGWAKGINSGEFLRAADLLADAKAALDIHPSEAAWRLSVAQDELSRIETTRSD
jgi:hypothetical protein